MLGLVVESPGSALEAVLSDVSIVDPSLDKRLPNTSKGDPPRLWTRVVSLECLQLIVLYHWIRAPNRPFRICQQRTVTRTGGHILYKVACLVYRINDGPLDLHWDQYIRG